jgi:hypothetical protein
MGFGAVRPAARRARAIQRCIISESGGKSLTKNCPEFKTKAAPGFEPGVEVLQTSALPLGDAAAEDSVYQVLVDLAKSYGLNFVLVAIKAKI